MTEQQIELIPKSCYSRARPLTYRAGGFPKQVNRTGEGSVTPLSPGRKTIDMEVTKESFITKKKQKNRPLQKALYDLLHWSKAP